MKNSATGLTRELVRQMAQRPNGLATSELPQFSCSRVGDVAGALVVAGAIYRAKISHKSVRFFGTKAEAAAWEDRHRRPADRVSAPDGRNKSKAWDKNAPIHYPTHPDGSPAWKFTAAAPPPARNVDVLTGLRFTSPSTPARVRRYRP